MGHSLWATDIKAGASGITPSAAAIEALFSLAEKKPKQQKGGTGTKRKAASLLDQKRSTNVAIVLSKFKIPHRALKMAIWRLDDTVLDEDDVVGLMGAVPTQEEIGVLQNALDGGAVLSELGKSEQYFGEVRAIPRLAARLETWHFMVSFEEQRKDTAQQLDDILGAIDSVTQSKSFRRVLAFILATGNFLNAGSFRAGAIGVKISALALIQETKQSGSNRTLIHHLARAKPQECGAIVTEFASVRRARTADFASLVKQADQLADGLAKLTAEATATQSAQYSEMARELAGALDQVDALPPRLESFAQEAGAKIASMQAQIGRCGEQLLVLCRFFELPSPKVIQDCAPTASEIFGILDNMAKSLEEVMAANAREDEAASKKRTPRRS